jgi:oligosaccharyltransferase complex subunit gamma
MSSRKTNILLLIIYATLLSLISSHPKADKLRELTLNSDRGLIVLNAQTYKEYVMSHPRPYDIVILYTLSPQRKCTLCERVFNEFIQVSDSFRDSNGFKPDMVSRKRAVFFAVLYYSEETIPIFKSLKFPSMTNLLYTTPQNIQFNNMGEPYIQYDEDYVISYNERSDKIYALKMMEFANAKSQRKFPLKKNPIEFLIYFLLFVGLIFIGFSAYKNFHPLIINPALWVVGSILVVIICEGGIVYNVLHSIPFAKYDRDGNIIEFIHTGQRSQYAGEGVLMSSLFVLGGTLLYSFNWLNMVKGYGQHKIASFGAIVLIVLIVRIIFSIYRIKARWYNPTFFPPGHYVKGPLINDQGNSF